MIRLAIFAALILAASPLVAGSGRQTLTIATDHSFAAIDRWIRENADAIEESAGATVADASAGRVTLSKQTKYGPQTFVISRRGRNGKYLGTFVRSVEGDLTDYACRITLKSLSERQTEITVEMSAECESSNGIAINVELRRSLRGMRNLFDQYLCRH